MVFNLEHLWRQAAKGREIRSRSGSGLSPSKVRVFKKNSGFTLLEILIVLSIVGIMVAIASPNASMWLANVQTEETADSFQSTVASARSEAIKRGGNVRICASLTGNSCASDFSKGWMMYFDNDGSGTYSSSAGDIKLRWQALKGVSVTVTDTDNSDVSNIGFNFRGYPETELSIIVSRNNARQVLRLARTGQLEHLDV